jgi:hypothetical protein
MSFSIGEGYYEGDETQFGVEGPDALDGPDVEFGFASEAHLDEANEEPVEQEPLRDGEVRVIRQHNPAHGDEVAGAATAEHNDTYNVETGTTVTTRLGGRKARELITTLEPDESVQFVASDSSGSNDVAVGHDSPETYYSVDLGITEAHARTPSLLDGPTTNNTYTLRNAVDSKGDTPAVNAALMHSRCSGSTSITTESPLRNDGPVTVTLDAKTGAIIAREGDRIIEVATVSRSSVTPPITIQNGEVHIGRTGLRAFIGWPLR